MNFFEAQDFFKQMYVGKKITFEFDEKCHRFIEIVHTDGLPHEMHHLECNKVKVNVEGMDSIYIPIQPHRVNVTWKQAKSLLDSKSDVYIHPDRLMTIKSLKERSDPDYEKCLEECSEITGLSKDNIVKKFS